MSEYEWDEEKRRANLQKHKLDFRAAGRVYESQNKITTMDPYPHEERFRDYAAINGTVRVLIYTLRRGGEVVRFISFRAAEPHEERWYYEEINNR
jgi:uncharacterized DUF497 family protein